MREYLIAVLVVGGLGICLARAEEAKRTPPKPDAAAIARLVTQLGSDRYADREAASEALRALGPLGLDSLRKAAKVSDLETRRRAAELVLRIEKQLETAELTQPKMVRLVYTDTPVPQAVQDISRVTGFTLQIDGDQTKLASRKVTLDTGEVPFWQAIDQFCEKAGLVERGSVSIPENTDIAGYETDGVGFYPPGGRRPVRAQTQLALLDGKPQPTPTYYGGAVRVRVLPRTAHARALSADTLLTVEISPEPKLGMRTVLSMHLDKILDDRGIDLKSPPPYINCPEFTDEIGTVLLSSTYPDRGMGDLSLRLPFRLQFPERVTKLKEVRGSIAAEVLTPTMPLLAMENILDAAGKSVDGKYGGSLAVSEVKSDDKGHVSIKIVVERPLVLQTGGLGGRVRIGRRGGMPSDGRIDAVSVVARTLSLVDGKGQAFRLTEAETKTLDEPARTAVEYRLIFQPTDGTGKATKLLYLGRRRTTIDVPFVLKDVPVP